MIIPLTSKKAERIYNYEVRTFVNNKPGKALLDQIKTVNFSRLIEKKGELTQAEMKAIYEKFVLMFDIDEY